MQKKKMFALLFVLRKRCCLGLASKKLHRLLVTIATRESDSDSVLFFSH